MNVGKKPTVSVIGASADRRKFGNKSVRAHAQCGYHVYPINPKGEDVEGWKGYSSLRDVPVERLDRITVYLPPRIGLQALDDIAAKPAGEIWFNPGAESREILERADQLGLQVIAGCSIVDLGVSPGQFPDA